MKERNNNQSQRGARSNERGVSLVEMLIVVMMIGILTAFAVMKIGGAQRAMRLTNSAREFVGWLEKARLNSLRRHAITPKAGDPDLRASVTIASANSYTVTIDQDGDGALDAARTFTIPATHGATFAGVTVPTTIRYDWRGRPVDNAGSPLNLSISLQDSNGNINPINLASTGDMSLGSNVNMTSISVSGVSTTSNIKAKMNVP